MADTTGVGARVQLKDWVMPIITLALAALTFAVSWGIQQRDREDLSRRIERLEAANTSERLAVIETKLDLIVSGLGLTTSPASTLRRQ